MTELVVLLWGLIAVNLFLSFFQLRQLKANDKRFQAEMMECDRLQERWRKMADELEAAQAALLPQVRCSLCNHWAISLRALREHIIAEHPEDERRVGAH